MSDMREDSAISSVPEEKVRPVRLRLSRARGFNLQAHSLATNGLPAVNVARPSKWGNPYKVGTDGNRVQCVACFKADLEYSLEHPLGKLALVPYLENLRGHNLACFCKADDCCHADVLLELANR